MDAKELIKAKHDYDAAQRDLNAHRYAASAAFRNAHPDDLGFHFDPTSMDMSHEEVGRHLSLLEDKVLIMERFLTGAVLTREEFAALGVDQEEYAALKQEYYPVRQPIPDGLIVMTFDDSTLDHFTRAAPVLEAYGARGVFFTCEAEVGLDGGTGFSDKSRYMTWKQIAELDRRGHEIGNHSLRHSFGFLALGEDEKRTEVTQLEARCGIYGIRRPEVFAYPGGTCDRVSMDLLSQMGYAWARGDFYDSGRIGQSYYDPLTDSPLAIPGFNGAPMFDEKQLARAVSLASGGRVVVLAYHGVDNADFGRLSLSEQLDCIYDNGGRCVTFRDLSEYIDPYKAYRYWQL